MNYAEHLKLWRAAVSANNLPEIERLAAIKPTDWEEHLAEVAKEIGPQHVYPAGHAYWQTHERK
jgi:hypothetical protein